MTAPTVDPVALAADKGHDLQQVGKSADTGMGLPVLRWVCRTCNEPVYQVGPGYWGVALFRRCRP